MRALRSVGILTLCSLLVFETTRFAYGADAAPATPSAQPQASGEDEGLPRWAWVTIAVVGTAAALALIFAFVVAPAAANNAGRAAANGAGSGDGGNGSILP